jgi:hypothetical protein
MIGFLHKPLIRSRWTIARALTVIGVLLVTVVMVGCGQKKTVVVNTPVVPDAGSNAATTPQSTQPTLAQAVGATVPVAPEGGADLRQLNQVYFRWIVQTHQRAKTFEDFVARSGINVPPPPQGKKYLIDHAGFIAMQNQ